MPRKVEEIHKRRHHPLTPLRPQGGPRAPNPPHRPDPLAGRGDSRRLDPGRPTRQGQGAGRSLASPYDWRRWEAMLNDWGQYKTAIDGLDIHFLHVRSKHENGLPLIITHGWPGSVIEFMK